MYGSFFPMSCVQSLQSCSILCDLWTVAHHVPLSMRFLRQEYWSGLPFPSPGDLLDPWIEPVSPLSLFCIAGEFLTAEPPGKPLSFPDFSKTQTESRMVTVNYCWSDITQSCPTLCNPVDCSLPGSSDHGIFQARVLEWVAISFSRGSSQPRDRTQVFCIASRLFTVWATLEAQTWTPSLRIIYGSPNQQRFKKHTGKKKKKKTRKVKDL